MMKTSGAWRGLMAGIVLSFFAAQAVAKEAEEVGLVTLVQGSVQVGESGAKPTAAVPFVKLLAGTKVEVKADGRFQIVYLNSGRQETWGANSQIEVGDTESKSSKAGKAPTVKQLPPAILKGLTQAPMMIADMRSRQGMIRVRSVGQTGKLEEAEKNYRDLRAQSQLDDVTPELFLLATLSQLKLHDKMKQPLEEMLARQPGNAEVRALHDSYMKQIAAK
jgi:hypothetical protein